MRRLARSDLSRPLLTLALLVGALLVTASVVQVPLGSGSLFGVLQYFATLGPVALGLGLTMILREYDLSVGATMGLAGCVAVTTGAGHPLVGAVCAVATGLAVGLVQGGIMVALRLSSIPVTLGGLLTVSGLSYVITDDRTLAFPDLDLAMALNKPLLGIFSPRSLIAVALFAAAAAALGWTRIGRDVAGAGSDRRAAATAGVRTGVVLLLVFMTSGGLSALSGTLLSYGLAAASPTGLTEILVPATAAAIIGGVSLGGGRGHALGIAAGVLSLCVLNTGLNALGLPPVAQNLVLGSVLLVVALADAPLLPVRLGLKLKTGRVSSSNPILSDRTGAADHADDGALSGARPATASRRPPSGAGRNR